MHDCNVSLERLKWLFVCPNLPHTIETLLWSLNGCEHEKVTKYVQSLQQPYVLWNTSLVAKSPWGCAPNVTYYITTKSTFYGHTN